MTSQVGKSSSVAGAQASHELTTTEQNRVNNTRENNKFRFADIWRKFVDFIDITSGFRTPKEIQKGGFLEQLWRQGAHFDTVATFRALVHQTVNGPPLDFEGLKPHQKARLRENLLDHWEIGDAIDKVFDEISKGPSLPGEQRFRSNSTSSGVI